MAKSFFITSSGTEIGKTFVTASLIHQISHAGKTVAAFKPLLSGFDENAVETTDTGILLNALGRDLSPANIDAMTPWRFKAALSPDMAAAREGKTIEFVELTEFTSAVLESNEDIALIEGVGGIMAPVGTDHTVLDWVKSAHCPALLVVGGYLGTISHTLTAAKALESVGVRLAGIVISARGELPVAPEETRAALMRFLSDTPVAILPDCGATDDAWRNAPDLLDQLCLLDA